jgi:outer membrane protein assembly factor BamB
MMCSISRLLIPFACALLMAQGLRSAAAEWPCYRGPNHDGVSTDPILTSFPDEGPEQVWKVPLEPGFSSFAVAGGRAFTQVRRPVNGEDREVCIALSASTGSELWATVMDPAVYDGQAGDDDGPRTTPSVDGGFVYVLSSCLKMLKLDATNGVVVWQKDLQALYGGRNIAWQNAASPLLDGDFIFLNCNSDSNSLMALRKSDGSLVWRRGTGGLTHATPVPATILGTRQIIFFTQSGLVSVTPESGVELWRYSFPFNTSAAASPVVENDIVYCSSGWGVGAGAVRISKSGSVFTVAELWRNANLKNEFGTSVVYQGCIYGLFGSSSSSLLPLKCVSLETGEERWSQPGFGPGGILLVDGNLLVTDARGGVILVLPYSRTYVELARFQAVSGKCWNSAALCNSRLYARSTTEAVCLKLSAEPAPALVLSIGQPASGLMRLTLSSIDGSAIDAARLSGISVRSSDSIVQDVATWPPVTNAMRLTNGSIQVDLTPGGRQCFYLTTEFQ